MNGHDAVLALFFQRRLPKPVDGAVRDEECPEDARQCVGFIHPAYLPGVAEVDGLLAAYAVLHSRTDPETQMLARLLIALRRDHKPAELPAHLVDSPASEVRLSQA
ncbi:hypothetical protein [Saccharothrix sp. ST-888]|uniref:hypothetical protein n=1 Tax=Saccharothrix sp. ST-888 TaxID=1427391 RepID=UPI0005ED0EA4|nr:hypothetical protein [Saccharothrix sp. ST-888]KJK55025.1 hypothetical protein UK12_31260 [Saccharothrix sp. ST-888]